MSECTEIDPWLLAADAARGDRQAEEDLWRTFRPRLKRMVTAELDPRISSRVDPSDVVQETILEAHRRLPECSARPPLPFYPWLRGIASDRIGKMHRTHLGAKSRDVSREVSSPCGLPDDSVDFLAQRLLNQEGCPVQWLLKEELRRRVRETLDQLSVEDRRVLILRLVEEMNTAETALVLGLSEPAVRMRQLRALERFADHLRAAGESGGQP